MSRKKKIIISLAVTIAVVGIIAGVLLAVKKNTKNKKTVEVYPVSELAEDGSMFYSWQTVSGTVRVKNEQKIYLTTDQPVAEVLVKEGDRVKAGDVIMRYDTTSQSLQLEIMAADVEIARVNVIVAERELEKLKNTTPIEPAANPPAIETPSADADNDASPSDAEPEPIPVPEPEPEPEGYTKEELEKAIKEKENQIRDLRTAYQLQQVKYEIASYQNANGDVLANFDGVVKTLADQDESILNNEPFIVIGTDTGYTVQSDIGEFDLLTVGVGDTVTMQSYENGMTYTGTITEISSVPSNNNYYYGTVETYYPITIAVDNPEGLSQGSWLEVSMDNSSVSSDSLYLQTPFVMNENGSSYVMKQVNGKLEKCYVKTGKSYWGSYIEIKAGLSMDDYIAFPYSSDAKEGTNTVEKSVYDSSLYR